MNTNNTYEKMYSTESLKGLVLFCMLFSKKKKNQYKVTKSTLGIILTL